MRGRVAAAILVVLLAALGVSLLPAVSLADIPADSRFWGYVYLNGWPVPDDTVISAWLQDPYVGPWTTPVQGGHGGATSYVIAIPMDDPSVPGKNGGVNGDPVYFGATINGKEYRGDSAVWRQASLQGHSLHLWLNGDANQDGVVNTLDVGWTERIILGLEAPTPGADANGDGVINVLDITTIEWIIVLDP